MADYFDPFNKDTVVPPNWHETSTTNACETYTANDTGDWTYTGTGDWPCPPSSTAYPSYPSNEEVNDGYSMDKEWIEKYKKQIIEKVKKSNEKKSKVQKKKKEKKLPKDRFELLDFN